MNLTDSSLASEILMTGTLETPHIRRQGVLTAVITAFSKGEAHQTLGLLDTCGNRSVVRQGSKFILGKAASVRAAKELLERGEDPKLVKAALKKAKIKVNTVSGSSVNSLAFIRLRINGVETPSLAIIVPVENLKSGEILVDNDTLAHTGIDLQRLQAQRKAASSSYPPVTFNVTEAISNDEKGYEVASETSSGSALRSQTFGQPLPEEWLGYVEDHEQISMDSGEVTDALLKTKSRAEVDTLLKSKSLAETVQADVYLSEMQCKRLLTDNPELFKQKTYALSDAEISDRLTPEQAAELRASTPVQRCVRHQR